MKSKKFFIRMLVVFLLRVKPASTRAKPGCIQNTSMAARMTHTVSSPLMAEASSAGSSVASQATASGAAAAMVSAAAAALSAATAKVSCAALPNANITSAQAVSHTVFDIYLFMIILSFRLVVNSVILLGQVLSVVHFSAAAL